MSFILLSSNRLLFVYVRSVGFYILILHPYNLLNSLIIYNSFYWAYQDKILSSAHSKFFFLSQFFIFEVFILSMIASILWKILTNKVCSQLFCLIPTSSISPSSRMLILGMTQLYSIILKKYSSLPISSAFYQVVEIMSILINPKYKEAILLTICPSTSNLLLMSSTWLVLKEDRRGGSPQGQFPRAQSRVEKKD